MMKIVLIYAFSVIMFLISGCASVSSPRHVENISRLGHTSDQFQAWKNSNLSLF